MIGSLISNSQVTLPLMSVLLLVKKEMCTSLVPSTVMNVGVVTTLQLIQELVIMSVIWNALMIMSTVEET